MIQVADMKDGLINQTYFNPPNDNEYTSEQIQQLEDAYMFKLDVLEKAKALVDAVNIMGIEPELGYAIYAIKQPQRNNFFKGFIYASKAMSGSLSDLRNEKTIEFFSKLTKQDYSLSLADLPLVTSTIKKSEINTVRQSLLVAVNDFIQIIEDYSKQYSLNDAEYGEILATALTYSHRTLQQSFTKTVVLALNTAILDEQCSPQEKDASVLGMYAAIASLHDEIYFPCI